MVFFLHLHGEPISGLINRLKIELTETGPLSLTLSPILGERAG
jgi:hypothetical protein